MSSPAEQARLDALRRLDVLDSETEQAFDDLTALAASICGTPISVISLVDADRLWFKSRVGLELDETPRRRSFCSHAILEDRILVVPDAGGDSAASVERASSSAGGEGPRLAAGGEEQIVEQPVGPAGVARHDVERPELVLVERAEALRRPGAPRLLVERGQVHARRRDRDRLPCDPGR